MSLQTQNKEAMFWKVQSILLQREKNIMGSNWISNLTPQKMDQGHCTPYPTKYFFCQVLTNRVQEKEYELQKFFF